jgi:hypothetical protein
MCRAFAPPLTKFISLSEPAKRLKKLFLLKKSSDSLEDL